MHVSVHAVGRMKAGPERELADRFFDRFSKTGPAVGLDFAGVTEIAESRASSVEERRREEAQRLLARSAGAAVVVLDERGRNIGSEELAQRISRFNDDGSKNLIFAIGGPDGHDEALRGQANLVLSFGELTWPHQLVRVMLAEQLYRVSTILTGHPYHRG